MKEELKTCLLFARLNEEQLDRVAQHATRIHLQEGEPLFEQGSAANRFFLVLRGQIKLFRLSPAGHEKIIDIVLPGQTFAEALMFDERPCYPVGAQALHPAEVIAIDARDYADLLSDSVQLCFSLLGDLSKRLRSLVREIDEISLHSATCRVATYLSQQLPPDGDTFSFSVAKQVIASRLSVTPETFSRILKRLHSEGIVTVDGASVTVHSRDALFAFVEETGGEHD